MVRHAGLLPYTNQYIGVPEVLLRPRAAGAVGHGAAARAGGGLGERRRASSARCASASANELVLLAWVVPFFLITGWFDVKFVRYLLPIYPIMILWAAAWLVRVAAALVARARGAVDGGDRAPGCGARLHVHLHAAAHGGDRLGVGLPPHPGRQDDPHPALGRGLPDAAARGRTRAATRSSTCRTTSPTSRRRCSSVAASWPAATTSPSRPSGCTARITHGAGEVPAQQQLLLRAVRRRPRLHADLRVTPRGPSLFGIEVPDELADESITVYDHPKVLIFENTGQLSSRRDLRQDHARASVAEADAQRPVAGAAPAAAPARAAPVVAADPLQHPGARLVRAGRAAARHVRPSPCCAAGCR